MRQFVLKLVLFVTLQAVVGIVIVMAYDVDRTAYIAATREKHERLAAIPPPRIIFVGGSSLAFGLDSVAVDRAFPDRGVVNLGLHAGLGLPFILREAEVVARPGDTLVVSLAYEFYYQDLETDVLFQLLVQRPASLEYVGSDLRDVGDNLLPFLGGVVRAGIGQSWSLAAPNQEPYDRANFNEYGDMTGHRSLEPRRPLVGSITVNASRSAMAEPIARLNAFAERMAARGVTVVRTYPPIPMSQFAPQRDAFEQLDARLDAELAISSLDRPGETVLDDSQFFDTIYHLNQAATEMRTQQLIESLRK